MTLPPDDSLLWVGRVVKTQGLKGQIRISGSRESAAFYRGNRLYLDKERETKKVLTVESVRFQRGVMILGLEEIRNIAGAEELVGSSVYVAKDSLQPLPAGEYYEFQILGMEVITEEGREVGKVEEIFPTGSNDVYVIRKDGKEVLIPATDEVVAKVDLEKKVMSIRRVEGLLPDDDF
jgi:16S rRNA processing protein RimM